MENETNTTQEEKGMGGITGAIIIIIILIAGGWYFIGGRMEKIQDQKLQNAIQNIDVTTGTSTEVDDIQKDLDNLNLDVLN